MRIHAHYIKGKGFIRSVNSRYHATLAVADIAAEDPYGARILAGHYKGGVLSKRDQLLATNAKAQKEIVRELGYTDSRTVGFGAVLPGEDFAVGLAGFVEV